MMKLNARKSFLLNKRLNLLKGMKCNEKLEVKFEHLVVKVKWLRNLSRLLLSLRNNEWIWNWDGLENNAVWYWKENRQIYYGRVSWAVIGVLNHDIHVNKYAPLEARSYIKLPDEIQNKQRKQQWTCITQMTINAFLLSRWCFGSSTRKTTSAACQSTSPRCSWKSGFESNQNSSKPIRFT